MAWWGIPLQGELLILQGDQGRKLTSFHKMHLLTLILGIVLLPKGKYFFCWDFNSFWALEDFPYFYSVNLKKTKPGDFFRMPVGDDRAVNTGLFFLTRHFVFQSHPWNAISVWVKIPAPRRPVPLDNLNVVPCQCWHMQVFWAWLLQISFYICGFLFFQCAAFFNM